MDEAVAAAHVAMNPYLSPWAFAEWASGGEWVAYRHLRFIANKIALAIARGNGRIIVNMPPRLGKSWLLSYWLPTWYLECWPDRNIIVGAHGADLAARFGRLVRNEFQTNQKLHTKLAVDSTRADQWNTPQGGGMKTCGVGSAITGWGGDVLLMDDPYPDWAAAYSPAYRRNLEDWWQSTFVYRREPGATIVLLHHRFAVHDLTAFLTEKSDEQWDHISLPNLAIAGDPLGRQPGEALCPERFTAEDLHRTRRAEVGSDIMFDALHQQNPRAIGAGAIYDRFGAANIDANVALNPKLPLILTLDFNINPGMHALVAQYDPHADRFVFDTEFHRPRMSLRETLDEFADWIKARGGFKFPELHVYGDATGASATAATGEACYDLVRTKLARMGLPYRVLVPMSNPAIVNRVMSVNDALSDVDGLAHVKIHPRCERLIHDFRNLYTGLDGMPDKTDQSMSHSSEAAGYFIYAIRPPGGRIEVPQSRFQSLRPTAGAMR